MKSFELSDNQMDDRADEVPPSETATAEAQPVASSLGTAAAMPQAGDPAPASESVQAESPLARYAFENKSGQWYLVIVIGIIGIAYLYSAGLTINIWLVPMMIAVPMSMIVGVRLIKGYRNVAEYPVFALYDDYLEFTPNLFSSSPLQIPYTEIISADMKDKNRTSMEIRRPGGSIDKEAGVCFHFIRSDDRDQAREQFRRKMEELGKLNATTAVSHQS